VTLNEFFCLLNSNININALVNKSRVIHTGIQAMPSSDFSQGIRGYLYQYNVYSLFI